MPDVIANALKWELGVDQSLNARMAECVRSCAMLSNACSLKIVGYRCGHPPLVIGA